jgi:hypothetical protein
LRPFFGGRKKKKKGRQVLTPQTDLNYGSALPRQDAEMVFIAKQYSALLPHDVLRTELAAGLRPSSVAFCG